LIHDICYASVMLQAIESRHRQMEATLADAKFLASRSNDNNDYYLQVSVRHI